MKRYISLLLAALAALSLAGSAAEPPAGAEEGRKYVALTFDDGPHPQYTRKVLDTLEEKGARATFFVVGFRVEKGREDLERMVKLGCEVENHTWSHADLRTLSAEGVLKELDDTNKAIKAAIGREPEFFRPPYGEIGRSVLRRIPMQEVMWTLDSRDWSVLNAGRVTSYILNNAKNGDIILMHDFYQSTADAVGPVIDGLRERGFALVTMSTLRRLEKLGEVSIRTPWTHYLKASPADSASVEG